MEASRFDRLTRLIARARSRRHLLAAVALGTLGTSAWQAEAVAGPGCKNVGAKCKNAGQCCSGICRGKKDKKTCKAHDTGGCKAGQQEEACGGVTEFCIGATGNQGNCNTTTGNAGFCASNGDCFSCQKDADCRPFCGQKAACIKCGPKCGDQGGTACVGPSGCVFQ